MIYSFLLALVAAPHSRVAVGFVVAWFIKWEGSCSVQTCSAGGSLAEIPISSELESSREMQKSTVSCARQFVQPVAPCPSHHASPEREGEGQGARCSKVKPGCHRAGDKVSLKVAQVLQGSSACPSQSSQESLGFHSSELQAKGPWLCQGCFLPVPPV